MYASGVRRLATVSDSLHIFLQLGPCAADSRLANVSTKDSKTVSGEPACTFSWEQVSNLLPESK